MVSTFIIAEAGVNHDGSLAKALRLIDIAAEAGADAVKFQTFRTEEVTSRAAPKAAYQQRETGEGSQFEMIKRLELSDEDHAALARRAAERKIEFMSTPFAPWAVELLVGLGMKRIKIASGEIVNLPLIRTVARTGLPIILSTGMATMAEVERAVGWIRAVWAEIGKPPADDELTVLHCTSDYPTPARFVNLAAMTALGDTLGVPVGYSDHSEGTLVAVAAVARGARVIEKHFTEDRGAFGPDHSASLDPAGLRALVEAIRFTEEALGSAEKAPAANELATRELVRRSAFARRPIAAGETITADALAFLRPGTGIGPERVDELIGRSAARAIPADAMLTPDDLA